MTKVTVLLAALLSSSLAIGCAAETDASDVDETTSDLSS